MSAQSISRFKEARPFASPEAAARKLLELVISEMAAIKQPHAYTGTVNSAFTRDGGSIAEYGEGIEYGVRHGLFELDSSGTRIKPVPNS